MNSQAFKSGIERALLSVGFQRHGKSLRRHAGHVWTLVGTEKGFGQQWHISIGFWLEALGAECPARVEQAHLHFRLERLSEEHHETITLAGALEDQKQPEAFKILIEFLGGDINSGLRLLGTEEGLRDAMIAGRLTHGLIRKEAREQLAGTRQP